MRRTDLLELLDDFKAKNAGASDFTISVPVSEARAVNTSLLYLQADGTISSFSRYEEPKENYFDIYGYEG